MTAILFISAPCVRDSIHSNEQTPIPLEVAAIKYFRCYFLSNSTIANPTTALINDNEAIIFPVAVCIPL